ncbi:zinc finger, CCHC-type containing protein, partial [Tanacetum coccineum]
MARRSRGRITDEEPEHFGEDALPRPPGPQRIAKSQLSNSGLKDIHQSDGFSVLTTPMPKDDGDDATVEQIRKRTMWDNDDYVCRGLILNGMADSLFDNYQNVESSKELWDSLEAKYMVGDASSKKFIVSNFTNYKMTDSRPVLEQYNEILGILGRFTQHKMNMDEFIQVSCIIDKLLPLWKYFKHTLKHLKDELTLVELGSHLRIEESLKAQDNDKPKGNNVVGPSVVNMVEHNNSSRYNDNRGATVHVCKDRCWFKTYESLNDGSILYMANESTTLVHGRGCVDLRFSSGKVVSLLNVLHVPNIRKNLVSSTFMPTFKLNNAILWHARLGHVHFKMMQDMSKDGLITAFDMDTEKFPGYIALWKEAINDVMNSIMGNNTWVLADLPPGCKPLCCKWIFKRKLKMDVKTTFLNGELEEDVYMNQPQGFIMRGNENKVDLTNEFLSSRFSMKDMGEADVILCIWIKHESNDTSEKLIPNNGQAVSQLEYYRVIGCLMYAMTCTRFDIAFVVGKLS